MKNQDLITLNFARLLHYGGQPKPVKETYDSVKQCAGYCVGCDEQNLPNDSTRQLYQMSHGADTWDYEQCFSKDLPSPEEHNAAKVMFIFESPGAVGRAGVEVPYKQFRKRPPVNHYYWMATPPVWPTKPAHDDKYGGYLAYLINHFHLKDAYITNAIKCGLRDKASGEFVTYRGKTRSAVARTCFKEVLSKEVEIFRPRIAFAFGISAHRLVDASGLFKSVKVTRLLHPACRGKWRKDWRDENDERIRNALRGSLQRSQ